MNRKIMRKAMGIIRKPEDGEMLYKASIYMITVFLCLGLIILSRGIKEHYMHELEQNARNLSTGYAHSLGKSVEAGSVVQQLIHDKLKGIAGIITNTENELESQELSVLSDQLKVDEINVYSEEAEVILSSVEEYVTWVPPMGHPVRDFIGSEMNYYVEPIRANAITGVFYLYGYERMTDGRVVQVGITAERVKELIGAFELNRLLQDMLTHEEVDYVKFISPEGIVLGSSDGRGIGTVLLHKEGRTLSSALDIGEFLTVPGEEVYDFREPVHLSEAEIGTLIVGIRLDAVREAIWTMNRSMTVVLVMLYLAAAVIIFLLHDKSRKLFDLAYSDEITRLPNAKYLKKTLSYELSQSPRKQLALIMIHVPRFRKISMVKGYEQGESILSEMAAYIRNQHIEGALLFRFSEEKFMMLISNYGKREKLTDIMETLSHMLPEQGGQTGEKRYNTLTFGALEISERYTSEEKALRDVLIALNHVNEEEVKPYGFFDDKMEKNIIRENVLESELKEAIAQKSPDRIFLLYQPLVDAGTEEVLGLEVLARMNSEIYGVVPPMEFITIAERNGLMVDLGKLILEKAMRYHRTLLEKGYRVRIFVNISPIQLIQDDFVSMMQHLLETLKMDPAFMELEITESVFLRNYALVNSKLKILRGMGFRIAIDDFGTGYSSFARLKELHVDFVKIDQYFIRRITKVESSTLITGDIIRMVHKFGLSAVAEGVETMEERDYLLAEGCDVLQGYFYSRPLPEVMVCPYLEKKNNNEGIDL